MPQFPLLHAAAGLALLLLSPVQAIVIRVPADQPTIQAGIDTAVPGDTVLVAPGVYPEKVTPDGAEFTLASNYIFSGNQQDVYQTQMSGLKLENMGAETAVIGLSISSGTGIELDSAHVVIRSCVIEGNINQTDRLYKPRTYGGGIRCYNSDAIIDSCIIRKNSATFGGGLVANSSPIVRNTLFAYNRAAAWEEYDPFDEFGGGSIWWEGLGGACEIFGGSPVFENCTFVFNSAESGFDPESSGGAIYGGPFIMENCLFYGNEAAYSPDINGYGEINCTNIFSNSGNAWADNFLDSLANINGNFSADPLFCDADNGDFHIRSNSPCATEQNSCAVLIGALDIGCEEFVCGDATRDYQVTRDDLDFLIAFYFAFGPSPDPATVSDLDCNGSVDLADIVLLAQYLNSENPEICCLAGPPKPPKHNPKKKPERLSVGPE